MVFGDPTKPPKKRRGRFFRFLESHAERTSGLDYQDTAATMRLTGNARAAEMLESQADRNLRGDRERDL